MVGAQARVYIADGYEVANGAIRKDSAIGGQRVAVSNNGTALNWLLTDHLGSTAINTDQTGAKLAEVRYYAWGSDRYTSGSMPTSYRYTGQRYDGDAIGLYYYGARYYDAYIGRFVQADMIVPQP